MTDKEKVVDFWNEASCGEDMLLREPDRLGYEQQLSERYRLEPFIKNFAQFLSADDKTVLEIGVGLGAGHQKFAENGAVLFGVDLTERAITHVKRRFDLFDLSSTLSVGDAENLRFENDKFDIVYSWGVIHHSPDTEAAVDEIF